MMKQIRRCGLLFAAVLFVANGQQLDRATALKLVQGRIIDVVSSRLSASPGYASFRGQADASYAYKILAEAEVLQCGNSNISGTVCKPGPNGEMLQPTGLGGSELVFVAGAFVADSILAVAPDGPGRAIADVKLVFRPTPLFQKLGRRLEETEILGLGIPPLSSRVREHSIQVRYRRYDAGWRVEPGIANPDAERAFRAGSVPLKPTATELVDAVMQGRFDAVQKFLASGVDPNRKTSSGSTALGEAAARCRLDFITLLLNTGAMADLRDETDMTPAARALAASCEKGVDALIAAGAKNPRRTPEATSVRCRLPSQAEYAVSTAGIPQPCADALRGSAGPHRQINGRTCFDRDGRTALMPFAVQGDEAFINEVLATGVPINARDKNGCSALNYVQDALKLSTSEASAEYLRLRIEFLKRRGAIDAAPAPTPNRSEAPVTQQALVELPAQSCSRETFVRLLDTATAPGTITFLNSSPHPVRVQWIDAGGKHVFYNRLAPGARYKQSTFTTHPWIITDDREQCIALFVALPGDHTATIH